jgi:hypothetical protein
MQTLQIQSYSYQDRNRVLPVLMNAITRSGGWVLDRKSLSDLTLGFRVEIELSGMLDLYSGIISSGLELTRSAHKSLTEMCMYSHHPRLVDPAQTVVIEMEVSFIEDENLNAILMTGASAA